MKPMSEAHFAILRRHMVEVIGIQVDLASEELGKAAFDERVLAALRNVPRHRFVPSFLAPLAYQDTPLPIGFDKTISQPFIVALMTDLLGPEPHESILEVGTGLGYQAAVLAELSPVGCGALKSWRSWQAKPKRTCASSAALMSPSASETGRVAGASTRPTIEPC